MSTPLRVLITTDAFPPRCGGSGWSTWELARGLTRRGHHVEVVKVDAGGHGDRRKSEYDGLPVTVFGVNAPAVPVVRNVVKNERLWGTLTRYLERERLPNGRFDIVHAQHVMSAVPAIRAGRAAGVPVVATVRDYWPVCYWSTLIVDESDPGLCPACTVSAMRRCVGSRAGGTGAQVAGWSVIPYMRRNLRTKRRTIAEADAVIAVSSAIARDLRARAPEMAGTPLFTIPNPFDFDAVDRVLDDTTRPVAERYLLYAGKLAPNKGVQYLAGAVADANTGLPLVVIGDGPYRSQLEADAHARGLDLRLVGWQEREVVWRWMRHATALVFPSFGPESLSRVLIEASALGVAIAAMDTGGTRDIVEPDETGLLSTSPDGLARDLARLVGDERLRRALGTEARRSSRERFSVGSVVERVEQVYRGLLQPRAA